MASKILWLVGSAIFVLLGILHLYYTFFKTRLAPRNAGLIDEMKNTSLQLTNETTMWKAWLGFNASHSIGAIFLGLMNIIMVGEDFSIIEDSFALSFLTIITSVFYLWLARKYWFRIPFVSILVAVCCFIVSPVLSFLL